jgi:formamidopyrimidine-DNA glycosylase
MPELPDITIYLEALERRIVDQPLQRVRVVSPLLLRTFEPSTDALVGRTVRRLRRLGKRIAIGFEDDVWFVLHLMIADQADSKAERRRHRTTVRRDSANTARLDLPIANRNGRRLPREGHRVSRRHGGAWPLRTAVSGQPCPECGAPVPRIRYADNETNYCARCQTDGVVLADRSLSRLLKDDWPRNIDEWEAR